MSEQSAKLEDLTPAQNLAKMNRVRMGYRNELKRGYHLMSRAQNQLQNAVEGGADDIVVRRFQSDVEQAGKLIGTSYGKLHWAAFKIQRLKDLVKKDLAAKDKKLHTRADGNLGHFPLAGLAGFKLESEPSQKQA